MSSKHQEPYLKTSLSNCFILIIVLLSSAGICKVSSVPKGTKSVDRSSASCNTCAPPSSKSAVALGTKNPTFKPETNNQQQDQVFKNATRLNDTTRYVLPSEDSNENSQVAFVNFDQVKNESDSTSRFISISQFTKREATLACGETNKNGKSSLDHHSNDIANRIVGGQKAEPGEYPFQVRLNIRSRRGTSMCGGVIIDKRHILTAAHCTTTCSSFFVSTNTVEPSSIKATVGDYKINSQDGEQVLKITSVKAHQRYSACSYTHNNYDIAILKTAKPMDWIFTKDGFGSVNRICLPKENTDYNVGENVTVSGWGVTSEGEGSISNTLKSATVPVVSLSDCRETYGQRVNSNHVCAGAKEGGKDSCQGDSGGPLFKQVDGQSELVGVVSFGYGCARESSPGVYTKVSNYIDWIKENL